jgi:hypothetical protein
MKRVPLILTALIAISSLTFGQNLQKGDFSASVNSEGWTLSGGNGDRSHIEFISFDKPYDSPPHVVVTLTGYDATAGKDGAVRIALIPEKITKVGCVIRVKTWGDAKVGAVWGTWMAWGK